MKSVKDLRFKRTLFVGLGGAGAKTLRILKEDICKANNGKLPTQIRFLLIDTNATDLANYRDFDCDEKVCIAVREPYQRYEHDLDLPTHEFIPPQNSHSLLALERGAGQVRSNGHFAVIENQYSNKLARIFRETAEALENINVEGDTLERDPKVEVRMVFSIAGGTGSGTFLPISVLIRSAIKHCEITAYMYSATHFERFVENSAKYSVMQNAYASLVELDYMMHFGLKDHIHEPITFNFGPEPNQQIVQSNRPFEEVYYIDKITSIPTPDTVEFAYQELSRVQKNTADALFVASTSIISSHTGTIDNVRQKVMEGQFDVNDKFAWISGLGMAEIFLDPQGKDSPKVVGACKKALEARAGNAQFGQDVVDSIVGMFMSNKWDESGGDNDGDPVLTNFLDPGDIKNSCQSRLLKSRQDSRKYYEEGITLDTVLTDRSRESSRDIIAQLSNLFKNNLQKLLVELIDHDKYTEGQLVTPVTGALGQKFGISLNSLHAVIGSIEEKLQKSIEKVEAEKKEHENEETAKARIADDFARQRERRNPKEPSIWDRLRGRTTQEPQDEPEMDVTTFSTQLAEKKADALYYRILAERAGCTIDVLKKCKDQVQMLLNDISHWIDALKGPMDYGSKKEARLEKTDDSAKKQENRVEVQLLEIDDYRLSLEKILSIVKDYDDRGYTSQMIFDDLCNEVIKESGSLQKYLSTGIQHLNECKKDKYNRNERTDMQKAIDKLLDLSTPTMQVDRHGYGDRVKIDQFWYVMTDCGETAHAEGEDMRKDLKDKSVGGLLKDLIEKNNLGEKVNLVHVDGWENKALLYRVKAAVPPYFVEGVCASDCGGITLESCYEELKMTKRTYTPFSHEILRRKLENGRTVLKPHDATADDIALHHWINFMILGYIDVKKERDHSDVEKQDMKGLYTIMSQTLGSHITGDVVNPRKILTLGTSTRSEAFNMFARYCKTLIKERPVYEDLTDPQQNLAYEDTFIMSAEQYMKDVLVGKFGFDEAAIKRLPEENPDKELIRKELAVLTQRMKAYLAKKQQTQQNESIYASHVEASEETSDETA